MNFSRRDFLKGMAVFSGAAVVAPSLLTVRTTQAQSSVVPMTDDITTWKITGSHFGAIRAKVVGDRVIEVQPLEFDKHPTEMIKGIPGLIYSSSRIRYPMVRLDWYKNRHRSDTAQRGDNRFVRVGWDDAIDLFYQELERVQRDYGPWALHTAGVGWRSVGQMHSCGNHMVRAIGMHGHSVGTIGDYSTGAGQVILPYVLGSTEVYSQGTSWDIILDQSKLIIFWANDPIKNLQVGWNTETHEAYAYYAQLKEKIARGDIQVICVDPVKNKTQNYLECMQQYVNPMTDVALMLAMAHTLVKEDLYDKEFLDTYALGFDRFVPYLEGKSEDNIEKTPEWAEAICGVPAERIRELSRMMAGNRTQLIFGWAVQRQQHGEQPYWMAAVLAAMLGQIGLPGGGISFSHHYSSVGVSSSGAAMPGAFPLNLDPGRVPKHSNDDYQGYSAVIPISRAIDALLEPGKEINFNGARVKLPPYKMGIFTGHNQWHRHQQRNRMKEAYRALETVVAIDYNWTATCRFADIVLPACTPYERNDIDAYGSYSNRGVLAMQKLIDPLFNSRPDFEIFSALCRRFNREDEYTRGMNEMEWIEFLYDECRAENVVKDILMPTFAEFWQKGYHMFPEGEPWVRHASFRVDSEVNSLVTPSVFIEIFIRKIVRYAYPYCNALPLWFLSQAPSHGRPSSFLFPLVF